MLHVFHRAIALHKRHTYDKSVLFPPVLNWAIVAAAFRAPTIFFSGNFASRVHKHKEWMSDKMWKL